MEKRRNGDAKLRWNAGKGRWIGPYWVTLPDGSKVRREVTGTDKAKVEAAWTAKKLEVAVAAKSGELVADGRLTVGRLFDQWVQHGCPSRKGKPSVATVAYNDRMIAVNLRPALGSVPINDLRPSLVTQQFEALVAKGYGRTTLARLRSILERVLWYADGEGISLPRHARIAAQNAIMPEAAHGSAQRRALSDIERAEVIAAFEDGHRFKAAVTVLAYAGLRPAEVFGLQWGDIDLDAGTLTVARAAVLRPIPLTGRKDPAAMAAAQQRYLERLTPPGARVPQAPVVRHPYEWVEGPVKCAQARRTIGLAPQVIAALRAHRAATGLGVLPTALVFPSVFYREVQDVQEFSKEVSRRTGVQPYDLRHTVASNLIQAGWTLPAVARYMGHQPETLMRVYAHAVPVESAVEVAALAKAFGP